MPKSHRIEEAVGEVLEAQAALGAIPVQVVVELGRTRLTIKQLMELAEGSIVELDGLAGEPMDMLIDGRKIAEGEVLVANGKLGIRLTNTVAPGARRAVLK